MKAIVVLVIALIGSIAAQSWMDSRGIVAPAVSDDTLYLRSGDTLKKASLGFDGLLADLYWIRTIQYFGEKLEAQRQSKDAMDLREMPQLESLLNITTELDPHHLAAYRFGGFFLRFLDPEKAVRFVRTGIRNNPGEWRLYQDLGYIYWRENRYREAADAYASGSNLAGAPAWMKAMSVAMLERGGDRETASEMLRRLCEGNEDPFIRDICARQTKNKRDSAKGENTLVYRMIALWDPIPSNRLRIGFAWIDPNSVSREQVLLLAKKLRQEYPREKTIRIYFWDDETDARLYGEAKVDEFSGYNKNLRVVYGNYQDRCVEFIEFYPDKKSPGKKETINFPCERKNKKP